MKFTTIAVLALNMCISSYGISMQKYMPQSGHIDECMVTVLMTSQYWNDIEKNINNHQFTQVVNGEIIPNPLRLTQRCIKSNFQFSETDSQRFKYAYSQLCHDTFYRIHQRTEMGKYVAIRNPLNIHPNAIDKHTHWEPIFGSEDITLIITFHDKATLDAIIEKWRK